MSSVYVLICVGVRAFCFEVVLLNSKHNMNLIKFVLYINSIHCVLNLIDK